MKNFVGENVAKIYYKYFLDDSNVTPDLLNAADSKVVSHFETLKVHTQSGKSECSGIFTLWLLYMPV